MVQKLLVSFSQIGFRFLVFELYEDCINAGIVKLILVRCNFKELCKM